MTWPLIVEAQALNACFHGKIGAAKDSIRPLDILLTHSWLEVPASLKDALSIVLVLGITIASFLVMKIVPNGELWLITAVSSFFAYMACKKLGWLAFVFVPFFPFLIFFLELDQEKSARCPFGIAIAAWSVFALVAIAGSWRWWKRLRGAQSGSN